MDPEMGGDPACWSHLFDGEGEDAEVVDLAALARESEGRGPLWALESTDLNANLIHFRAGEGVAEHVNSEVDVLLIGVLGAGIVTINGVAHAVPAGSAILIPKGANRSIAVDGHSFTWLTCHRRRPGLVPKPTSRLSRSRERGRG